MIPSWSPWAVAQAATGLCSDRQFLATAGRLLPGYFPALPDQSQYNRRLRRLTPWITTVQLMVAELIAEGPDPAGPGATTPSCAASSQPSTAETSTENGRR